MRNRNGITHRNHPLDLVSTEDHVLLRMWAKFVVALSRFPNKLSGLMGNYKTVAKPGAPVWPHRRTCTLLVAEKGPQITEACTVGLCCL